MKDSNTQEDKLDKTLCLSCLGSKARFNGLEYEDCVYCDAKGIATLEQNEYFLYQEINQQ